MADYISREAAIKAINDMYEYEFPTASGPLDEFFVKFVPATLRAIPAADVVEVVRCKDCEYWGDENGRIHLPDGRLCDRCKAHSYLVGGRYIGLFPPEDGFCRDGKRRGE